MGDRMRPPAFPALMERILSETAGPGTAAGHWKARERRVFPFLGDPLESPVGPAAGPHTQLAGNIVAAYLAGGRFFELKTVQALDGEDLRVAKPCILAEDEGYNCEWSTELTVRQAMDEYIGSVRAAAAPRVGLACARLVRSTCRSATKSEGIRGAKVDRFIEG